MLDKSKLHLVTSTDSKGHRIRRWHRNEESVEVKHGSSTISIHDVPSRKIKEAISPKRTIAKETKEEQRKPEVSYKVSMDKLKSKFALKSAVIESSMKRKPGVAEYHIAQTTKALGDLARLLGVPAKQVSMNGRLSFQIGIPRNVDEDLRDAEAYYQPDSKKITLSTAMQEGGTLAHEMFHAIDNIVYENASKITGSYESDYLTSSWILLKDSPVKSAIGDLMAAISGGGKKKSKFLQGAIALDEGKRGNYWSQPHEMAARAFEAWCEDKLAEQGKKSTYLVIDANNEVYAEGLKPYPEGKERKRINESVGRLVEALKQDKAFQKAFATLIGILG